MRNPFRYFNSSPAVIHTAVLLYIRFPLSLRQVEDLLHEGASISVMRQSDSGGTASG
jgi:transposase-like protein